MIFLTYKYPLADLGIVLAHVVILCVALSGSFGILPVFMLGLYINALIVNKVFQVQSQSCIYLKKYYSLI